MALLAAFDLCVLCSNSETSAYGVSEPMALGRPVVATAVGGIPELIEHGQDGWLCPPRDAEALADAVCALLADEAAARRWGTPPLARCGSACRSSGWWTSWRTSTVSSSRSVRRW